MADARWSPVFVQLIIVLNQIKKGLPVLAALFIYQMPLF
jgi:hypothetical protein